MRHTGAYQYNYCGKNLNLPCGRFMLLSPSPSSSSLFNNYVLLLFGYSGFFTWNSITEREYFYAINWSHQNIDTCQTITVAVTVLQGYRCRCILGCDHSHKAHYMVYQIRSFEIEGRVSKCPRISTSRILNYSFNISMDTPITGVLQRCEPIVHNLIVASPYA